MLADSPIFRLRRGNAPLLISIPHGGTRVPEWLRPRLLPEAANLPDTDWCLDQLYDFAHELDATLIAANYTRYVVDLNRPPDNASLYPGQRTTGLCPVETFDGHPLYARDDAPHSQEIANRIAEYWQPYHHALGDELERLSAAHDNVVLWDAHSIRSQLPRLFDGELPSLNIGTADHAACAPEIAASVAERAEQSGYSHVFNGRFKGGYITRNYGNPAAGIHAIQMEIAQRAYMRESSNPAYYDETLAAPLRKLLRAMLEGLIGRCALPDARD
ncbi:MAG: N-formylglutamate deformylase [Methylobacillus sp.]|jgi:N-formylglutamate deformylase|nr:N-formylglutamate deformylase [Methylobacillus sp.]